MKKFLLRISCILVLVAGVLGVTMSGVHALEENIAAWVEEARGELALITEAKDVMALVYLSDEYPIRLEPSYDSAVVQTVRSGQQVHIKDVFLSEDYEVWSFVRFYYGEQELWGYIPRPMLACSDMEFLEWEDYYGMNPASRSTYAVNDEGKAVYADVETFPESYKAALIALKEKHPNWTFVKMDTGLDWNSSVNAQMQGGRSLVPNSYPAYTKEGVYGAGWSYASDNILAYHMDPRNFLTEAEVFQFELLTYNATYHTQEALQLFLDNTFMKGIAPGLEIPYSLVIWAHGKDLNVSPFHMAARIYQEQGQGTSDLISGNYMGPDKNGVAGALKGYYNYFNVKASGHTQEEIIVNGLTYAKNAMDVKNPTQPRPWTDAYWSIQGGAHIISANYIAKGQDTLYLQKFNVNTSSPYGVHNHQYMQNIVAPSSEGKNIKKLYAQANSLENTFVFKIPVFQNMPETATPYPSDKDVVLTAPEGYEDATIYLDGVAYEAFANAGEYLVSAPNTEAKSAVMYKYNEKGIPTGMYCWSLSYDVAEKAYVETALPELEDLLSYHGFAIRIKGKSGIRFETSISAETRESLFNSGLAGYKLKEYGSLVMKEAVHESNYPLIKDGIYTRFGKAFGYRENGTLQDAILKTEKGRYHFANVLIGLPANEYETRFAFRGYVILEKEGVDTIFYGPIMARSIYQLAEVMVDYGYYQEGTAEDIFLKQIISDAEALRPKDEVSSGDAVGGEVSSGDAVNGGQ